MYTFRFWNATMFRAVSDYFFLVAIILYNISSQLAEGQSNSKTRWTLDNQTSSSIYEHGAVSSRAKTGSNNKTKYVAFYMNLMESPLKNTAMLIFYPSLPWKHWLALCTQRIFIQPIRFPHKYYFF